MTTETVLTEEQIQQAVQCITAEQSIVDGSVILSNVNVCILALEQAVLQSPEIQELRKDRARLDSGCIITNERDDFGDEYACERRGYDLRASIDAAMEKQP